MDNINSPSDHILNKNTLIISEYIKDPKFKTEMCKNWEKSSSCPYNTKCRFAHGKHELMAKELEANPNYRIKDCLSFFKYGYCSYGRRCCFRHDERKINESTACFDIAIMLKLRKPEESKRLSIFEELPLEYVSNNYNSYNSSMLKNRKSVSSYSTVSTKCSNDSGSGRKASKVIGKEQYYSKKYKKSSVVINECEDTLDLSIVQVSSGRF